MEVALALVGSCCLGPKNTAWNVVFDGKDYCAGYRLDSLGHLKSPVQPFWIEHCLAACIFGRFEIERRCRRGVQSSLRPWSNFPEPFFVPDRKGDPRKPDNLIQWLHRKQEVRNTGFNQAHGRSNRRYKIHGAEMLIDASIGFVSSDAHPNDQSRNVSPAIAFQ